MDSSLRSGLSGPEGISLGSVKNLGYGSYGQTKEEWR